MFCRAIIRRWSFLCIVVGIIIVRCIATSLEVRRFGGCKKACHRPSGLDISMFCVVGYPVKIIAEILSMLLNMITKSHS